MKTLPNKPSALIKLALKDLRACESNPTYKINMYVWHTERSVSFDKKHCQVCLAGAVMAKSLKVRPYESKDPLHYKYDKQLQAKLWALDVFKSGHIGYGLHLLGFKNEIFDDTVNITEYSKNPTRFKKQMTTLARHFERAGL